MKKRVISFSIFREQSKYLQGIEENISLAHLFYPGWYIYIMTIRFPKTLRMNSVLRKMLS